MIFQDADCHMSNAYGSNQTGEGGKNPVNFERAESIKQSETHGRVSFLTAFTDVLILYPICPDEYRKKNLKLYVAFLNLPPKPYF